jgi:hypothetical protein
VYADWVQAFWKNESPSSDRPTEIAAIERRGWFTCSDSSSFAILSLRLAPMSDQGFPPRAVAHHLAPHFNDDHPRRVLEFLDFPFSLPTKTVMNSFKSDMVILAQHLKE